MGAAFEQGRGDVTDQLDVQRPGARVTGIWWAERCEREVDRMPHARRLVRRDVLSDHGHDQADELEGAQTSVDRDQPVTFQPVDGREQLNWVVGDQAWCLPG